MAPPSSAGSKRGGKRKTKKQLEEEAAQDEARLKAELEAAEARRKDEEVKFYKRYSFSFFVEATNPGWLE
jgi:hypothetical protein